MKKNYIAPTTICIDLHAANMIAVSLNNTESVNSSNMSNYTQDAREDQGWDVW